MRYINLTQFYHLLILIQKVELFRKYVIKTLMFHLIHLVDSRNRNHLGVRAKYGLF